MKSKDNPEILRPSDAKHWKFNHDNIVKRCALLSQRPDLPVDRIPAYVEMKRLQEVERNAKILKKALEDIIEVTCAPMARTRIDEIDEIASLALAQYNLCQDPVCEQSGQPHAHIEVIRAEPTVQNSQAGEAPFANWGNRHTDNLSGWVNELMTLADHKEIRQGWLRQAIRTIANGVNLYAAPSQPVAGKPSDERIIEIARQNDIPINTGKTAIKLVRLVLKDMGYEPK